MKVRMGKSGDFSVIVVNGKMMGGLDAQELEGHLSEALQTEHSAVVDLSKCEWLSTTELGMLLYYYRQFGRENLEVYLVLSPTEGRLERLIMVTGLAEVFKIYKSLDEAIAELSSTPEVSACINLQLVGKFAGRGR
jgi:anti-anti-sigma factor